MGFQQNRQNANVTDSGWSIQSLKAMTFTGQTNAGAVGTTTLFTVTGAVLVRLFGKVVSTPGQTSSSVSPSSSASASISGSVSPSSSASSSESRSVSPSSSASPSHVSPSGSVSPSASTSGSPSGSASPSGSVSPSASASSSTSGSISPSASVSPSGSSSASASPSASVSPSSSVSASPSSGTTQASISVGTATNNTVFITTTPIYLLVTNRIWVDATPTTTAEPIASVAQYVVTEDIIQTITTESTSSGRIDYYCSWYPLSADSSLVAA